MPVLITEDLKPMVRSDISLEGARRRKDDERRIYILVVESPKSCIGLTDGLGALR